MRYAIPDGAVLGLAAVLTGGCAPTTNLLHPTTPRFEGSYAAAAADSSIAAPLRVVTFNIKLGRRIDRAIEVLRGDSLRDADVLALEEMDETGVDRIARTLGLNYAYYPGVIHPTDNRYFGPAILSRWPIERSWKLVLPHQGRWRKQVRTATAADLRIHGQRVRVYAVHLETQLRISEKDRADQVLAIARDAADVAGPVVIAGDFNSYAIGPVLARAGFRWTTEMVGPTIAFFSWDHVFSRGLEEARPSSAGVVRQVRGASDHHPVWAVLSLAAPSLAGVAAALPPAAPIEAR